MLATPAKPCYSHIGGRLGTLLMEQFIEKGWIKKSVKSERMFYVTTKGQQAFAKMNIDISLIPKEEV